MANADIRAGYPYATYAHHADALPERDERLAALLLDYLNGRLPARQLCADAGFGDAADAFESFRDGVESSSFGRPVPPDAVRALGDKLAAFLEPFVGVRAGGVAARVARELHAYRVIQPLFDDDALEEIFVNGAKSPVFAFHRTAGLCKTNVSFKSDRELRSLLLQLAPALDRPFEDVRLPDGSRANVAVPPVTEQPVVTIRKFRKRPFSVVDLMRNGTVSPGLAAFLWTAIEGYGLFPANVLIVGGTSSGKTTLLNCLSAFIPPSERLVTAEDVRELDFGPRENWIALETAKRADLADLVHNAVRMRPDRVIVGEIRGREAEAMFHALNVGHRGSLGTLHANSDRDAVNKLENPPMGVPRALIPLLDVIVVMHRVHDRRKGVVRRVTQVSEVSRLEDVIGLNEVFVRDAVADELNRTTVPPQLRERLAKAAGMDIASVMADLQQREEILNYLAQKNVSSQADVQEFMRGYYEKKRRPAPAGA